MPVMADVTEKAGLGQTCNAVFSYAVEAVLLWRNAA